VKAIGTMTEYNKACNWVADKIFGFQLQEMLYYDVKSLFNVPSQSVIRLITKVVEAYKRDIKIKPVFRETRCNTTMNAIAVSD
jgi:putative transposase